MPKFIRLREKNRFPCKIIGKVFGFFMLFKKSVLSCIEFLNTLWITNCEYPFIESEVHDERRWSDPEVIYDVLGHLMLLVLVQIPNSFSEFE